MKGITEYLRSYVKKTDVSRLDLIHVFLENSKKKTFIEIKIFLYIIQKIYILDIEINLDFILISINI